MKTEKLNAINELTSPLFRIMSVHNGDDAIRRFFDNNICAFHVGNGYVLSVAHNLRGEATFFKSISEPLYQKDILPHLNPAEKTFFNQSYPLDSGTQKRYINLANQDQVPNLVGILSRINFDTRWSTMYKNKICKPYLLIQQRCINFYDSAITHKKFNQSLCFLDSGSNRQTYMLETELVEAFYEEDIALYKIINTDQSVINLIPKLEIDFEVYDNSDHDFYCLQGGPTDMTPGRMINEANIEGLLDQFTTFNDRIGGNYHLQGLRYLIKGYFRFGSSGAPYIKYHEKDKAFKVNAIQSEASPLQLTIKNDSTMLNKHGG